MRDNMRDNMQDHVRDNMQDNVRRVEPYGASPRIPARDKRRK